MPMNKFMRILVFFDLPVKTKAEKREATKFRKFLINDGYHMLQYSVYAGSATELTQFRSINSG